MSANNITAELNVTDLVPASVVAGTDAVVSDDQALAAALSSSSSSQVRALSPNTNPNPKPDPTGSLTPVEMDTPLIMQNQWVQYAVSALRPNVVTSTAYSMAFVKGLGCNYISIDRNRDLQVKVVEMEAIVSHVKNLNPDTVFSVEIGEDSETDNAVSLRLTCFEKDHSKFRFLVLFNPGFAVIYYSEMTESVKYLKDRLRTEEPKELPAITRVDLGGQGVQFTKTVLAKVEPIVDEFYPQVAVREVNGAEEKCGMKLLMSEFFKAHSSIVTLMGEWGCGKSTLMRMMANEFREGREFFIIEDIALYQSSQAFTELIGRIRQVNVEGKQAVVFLEEADPFLVKKTMDNPFLSRFLSLSDGATAMNVKFVLAMNQSNEKDIDHSVLRGGRSFATIRFSKMTPEQANAARKAIGLEEVEFPQNVTLAEALGHERQIFGKATLDGTNKHSGAGFY